MNINAVKAFWNTNPCDTPSAKGLEEGSLEFFEQIENYRYSWQSAIHSIAQFTRWRNKAVLEIGCGVGTDFLQFARAGANLVGIDVSKKSVELTNKRLELYDISKTKVSAVEMNAEDILFEDNTFDLVYSWGVIHHSPDPQKVIDEIYRVLKPEGLFRGMLYHRKSTMSVAVWLRDIKRHHNPFISLTTALSRSLESPGTKAYSPNEIKKLFKNFRDIKISSYSAPEFYGLRNTPFLFLLKYYPDCFSSWLIIEAKK